MSSWQGILRFFLFIIFAGTILPVGEAQRVQEGQTSLIPAKDSFPRFEVVPYHPLTEKYFLFCVEGFLTVLDREGDPLFFRSIPGGARTFICQPSGDLTYYANGLQAFVRMDRNYRIKDTLSPPGGQTTDFHSLRILEDGRIFFLATEIRKIDMSDLVEGGDPQATVKGPLLTVTDSTGHILFFWRGLDHISVTDADEDIVDLTASVIDYMHVNNFTETPDGNYLITSRNLSEVTKISATDGSVIWRMAGKHNQFSGDDLSFQAIHDANYIDSDRIMLFDNGLLARDTSWVRVYRLDESHRSVTLLHTWKHPVAVFVPVMGNACMSERDEVVVGWGKNDKNILFSVMDTLGHLRMDVKTPGADGLWTYRVSVASSRDTLITATIDSLSFGNVPVGDTSWIRIRFISHADSIPYRFTGYETGNPAFSVRAPQDSLLKTGDTLSLFILFSPAAEQHIDDRMLLYFEPLAPDDPPERILRKVMVSGGGIPDRTTIKREQPKIGIRPNPVHETFTLSLDRPARLLTILDASGRIRYRYSNPENNETVQVGALVNGFYWIRIDYPDGRHIVIPFLKQ